MNLGKSSATASCFLPHTPLLQAFCKRFATEGLFRKLLQSLYYTKLQEDPIENSPLFTQQHGCVAHMEKYATREQRSNRSNDMALQHVEERVLILLVPVAIRMEILSGPRLVKYTLVNVCHQ